MEKAWIVADRNDPREINFLYNFSRNRWGKDRCRCEIFSTKVEAEELALKMDSTAWEVSITMDYDLPFIVLEWAKL